MSKAETNLQNVEEIEDKITVTNQPNIDDIIAKVPEDDDKRQNFSKFIDLVKSDKFPMDNVCFSLFRRSQIWHSEDNLCNMRYSMISKNLSDFLHLL